MSKRMYGSICLTDLGEAVKKKHSSIKKGEKNGKLYANVTVWINEEEDEFGNIAAVQLSSSKEARENGSEKKATYIGNLKQPKDDRDQELKDIPAGEKDRVADDLPF